MEKVLVTGGAGFIGSNLSKMLIENGFQVKILDNLTTGYLENLKGLDIEFIHADIRDNNAVNKALKGIHTVFHLAAHIGNVKSIQFPYNDLDINCTGTLNLLEEIKKSNVQKVIYSSSAAIYGELQSIIVDENHLLEPITPYGVSKLAAEKYVLTYGKLYGFIPVVLRYFNVYGINQRFDTYGNVIPIFINCIANKTPLTVYGNGEQTRDFINVTDVAYANFLAMKNAEKTGIFNVGCGKSITINSLVDILKDKSGYKINVNYEPPRKGEVLHCTADISKLNSTLNYSPQIPFNEGVNNYFEWFMNEFSKMK